jgi:restriction system protein
MAIPDFQTLMLPLLKFIRDGIEHTITEAVIELGKEFSLTKEELEEMLPSRNQRVFYNRVTWAKARLKMASLVENTSTGKFQITSRGQEILNQNPARIDLKFLRQIPEYIEFNKNWKSKLQSINNDNAEINESIETQTPDVALEISYQNIRKALAQDLLSRVKKCTPKFFETLVVKLLVKMGYGGSLEDAGRVVGKGGDEGIDGIIKEDKLGLDVIYIQAKRWDGNVGRQEIQRFVGALAGQGAKKGVFITTSRFTPDAKNYLPRNETKVVLINGEQLSELMIDYNVGVTLYETYEIKRLDNDFFDEE